MRGEQHRQLQTGDLPVGELRSLFLREGSQSLSAAEAPDYFGWLAVFAGLDMAASSAWTQAQLGWTPTGPGLIEDLKAMDYSTAASAA